MQTQNMAIKMLRLKVKLDMCYKDTHIHKNKHSTDRKETENLKFDVEIEMYCL